MMLIYQNLISIFTKEFPEVINCNKEQIESIAWEISENLVYTFYEEIVKPTFLKLLKSILDSKTENNYDLFNRFINYFEKMSQSEDIEVCNVLGIAIFEDLSNDINVLKFLYDNLKEKSKIIFNKSWNIKF